MASENWQRLADYVIAGRVALGMRDRRALAAATGVTERTLGKLENGQRVSASTVAAIENRLGWAPGTARRILAGGDPDLDQDTASDQADEAGADPTLRYLAGTPGLPPDVVRGLIALARNWRDSEDDAEPDQRRA